MTIYTELKKDHEEVKTFLNQLEAKPDDEEALSNLIKELSLHNPAEEKVFYDPLIKKLDKMAIVIEDGDKEHHKVMDLIKEYSTMTGKGKERKILLTIIKKSLEGHIDKEENEMFKLAKDHIDSEEAKAMGVAFEEEKEKIKKKLKIS